MERVVHRENAPHVENTIVRFKVSTPKVRDYVLPMWPKPVPWIAQSALFLAEQWALLGAVAQFWDF